MSDSAVCAHHDDRAASRSCARCGVYVCSECAGAGALGWCPECRGRRGIDRFPLNREDWTIRRLLRLARTAYRAEWTVLGLGALLMYGISAALNVVSSVMERLLPDTGDAIAELGFLGLAAGVGLVQRGLQLGFFRMCTDAMLGRAPQVGDLLGMLKRTPTIAAQLLAAFALALVPAAVVAFGLYALWEWTGGPWGDADAMLWVLGAGALLAPVVAYLGVGFVFMQVEIAYDPHVGPLVAMGRSWKIVRGARWRSLLVLLIVVLYLALGLMICGVGLLATAGMAECVFAGLYLTLRSGSGVPIVERGWDAPPPAAS